MSALAFPGRGLYVITDTDLHTGKALAESVARAIDGGAKAVQYRDKSKASSRRHTEALMLVRICRPRGVALIINDDVELAFQIGADGVHLGRDDTPLQTARERLGADCIIGVSCYDDVERGQAAERHGADYVAFGSMFPSMTKPGASRATMATIAAARQRIRLPIVAIGGITPQNGASLLSAGVDVLAVVRGVFGADDPAEAARQYARLFSQQVREEEQ
jgi:thiamine-phosphate pyrophosphorylase